MQCTCKVQATGIAALHACFMRGNPPYAHEFHEKNTRETLKAKIQAKIHEKKLASYRWLYLSWESENCLNFSGYNFGCLS